MTTTPHAELLTDDEIAQCYRDATGGTQLSEEHPAFAREIERALLARLGEQKPVARIAGVDEYGPLLEWFKHWTEFADGTKLYAHPPAAQPVAQGERLTNVLGFLLGEKPLDGAWFGDPPPRLGRTGLFWWRVDLRAAMAAELEASRSSAQGAAQVPPDMTAAVRDVLAERQRQVVIKGFDARHDDENQHEEMAFAAACYVTADEGEAPPAVWPWGLKWWKPKGRRTNLVKAAALTIAEIERLDRDSTKEQQP